jgi:hypothetical protein
MLLGLAADAWIAIGTWVLVIVTAIFMWRQTQVAKEAARLQLFVSLTQEWQGLTMRSIRKQFALALLKAEDGKPAGGIELDETVLEFFESLGYLTKTGLLDERIVWNYFSFAIMGYCLAAKPVILGLIHSENDEVIYGEFGWLNRRMLQLDQELRGKSEKEIQWPSEKVKSFLQSEVDMF